MRRLVWIALLLCLALLGCEGEKEKGGQSPFSSQTSGQDQSTASKRDSDPLSHALSHAAELCGALHTLAATRRGECCGSAAPSDISAVCTAALDAVLKRSTVRIDATAVTTCTEAVSMQLQGCDWVGSLPPVPPPVCRTLVQGTLAAGSACESSLECNDGLYCRGASPGVGGVCAPPADVGALCEIPSDNLAVAVHGQNDPRHPSCNGACVRGQCLAREPDGAACSSSALCQNGLHCIEGRCSTATLAADGAACSSTVPCSEGLVCNNGSCATPAGTGTRCRLPFECRSLACIKAEGEEWGQCADACAAPPSVGALGLPAPQTVRLAIVASPDA